MQVAKSVPRVTLCERQKKILFEIGKPAQHLLNVILPQAVWITALGCSPPPEGQIGEEKIHCIFLPLMTLVNESQKEFWFGVLEDLP